MENETLLNIAAGRVGVPADLWPNAKFVINLDTMYFSGDNLDFLENAMLCFLQSANKKTQDISGGMFYARTDVYEFLERFKFQFDVVTVYRYLEHVPMDKVLYFIYLLSTIVKKGGCVDIIVPDYDRLAKMILDEDVTAPDFEAHNILLTTELLNDPGCPHASIWTENRLDKFFTLENRFILTKSFYRYMFDGRDIYCRTIWKRI